MRESNSKLSLTLDYTFAWPQAEQYTHPFCLNSSRKDSSEGYTYSRLSAALC